MSKAKVIVKKKLLTKKVAGFKKSHVKENFKKTTKENKTTTVDEEIFKPADAGGDKKLPKDLLKVQTSGDWEPSQCRLAARLGCSQQSIKNYILRGMPFSPSMGYNVDLCVKWINEWKASRPNSANHGRPLGGSLGPISPLDPSERMDKKLRLTVAKLQAETLKLKQDTRGKRLKNDEYEGLLLPADEVRLWIASRFLRIKQRLEMLPDELQMLAPAALRPQLRTDIANAIHALLMEMSGWQSQAETKEFTGEELDG